VTKLSFSAEQVAALFSVFGQPVPPVVSVALPGADGRLGQTEIADAHDSLMANGHFVATSGGEVTLSDSLADTLAVCFYADKAATIRRGERVHLTLYAYGDSGVVIAPGRTGYDILFADSLASLGGVVCERLGEPGAGDGLETVCAATTLKVLEKLFQLQASRESKAMAVLAQDEGWDAETVVEIMEKTDSDDLAYVSTAFRQGGEGQVHTRIRFDSGCAWVISCVLVAGQETALIARCPASKAVGYALDFVGR